MSLSAPAPGATLEILVGDLEIAMGESIDLRAELIGADPSEYLALPFVNKSRWGAHERFDADGVARFQIPLPNPGPADVEVLLIPLEVDNWMGTSNKDMLMAGHPMPLDFDGPRSNITQVTVLRKDFQAHTPGDTAFAMQWEPWFTPQSSYWNTAHAVPLVGFYASYHRDVARQHILWFVEMGVDFVLPDWSNHIWGREHWHERGSGTNTIIHATTLFLEELADMRDEGIPVPQVAIMPGLSNGPPAKMQALNEQLEWIHQNYLRNPRFNGLWFEFDDKPLVVVLDTNAMAHPDGRTEAAFRIPFVQQTLGASEEELDQLRIEDDTPVDDTHFTVRWMSTQLQTTQHHELGYWTWMDGSIEPVVTYNEDVAEAVTVTPAFFAEYGWMAPEAYGRRGGATLMQTFEVALEHRPKVVFLHQFNEFAGQREGGGYGPDNNIYVDSYSVEFSDDLEPVSLTAPGYRDDPGGWGFYYLNLTQALMAFYREVTPQDTLMAISTPLAGAQVSDEQLQLAWTVLGPEPQAYRIEINGAEIARVTSEQAAFEARALDIALNDLDLPSGSHTMTIVAEEAHTRFPLSYTSHDRIQDDPVTPRAQVAFVVE